MKQHLEYHTVLRDRGHTRLWRQYYFFVLLTAIVFVFFNFSFVKGADTDDPYGLKTTAEEATIKPVGSEGASVTTLVGNVVGTGLSLISVLFFLLMIWGGLRWMLSRGNEEETKKALNIIFSAIIGILIVLSSYAITKFVFGSVNQNIDIPSGSGIDEQQETGEKACLPQDGKTIHAYCDDSYNDGNGVCPGPVCEEKDEEGVTVCRPLAGKSMKSDVCGAFSTEGGCTAGVLIFYCEYK